MACLKCLVCNTRIDNNYNNDSSQLFKTVCSLLDLDSDLDNFILNSPLTISNAFCDDCQVIAAKLFNLQTSLIQIQQSIKTTISTITKTIVQTQTQQEQKQKGKNEKKTVVKIPCEDGSKLIPKLRKIVHARFSPVIKILPCQIETKPKTQNKLTAGSKPKQKTVRKIKVECDSTSEDDVEFYDDLLHDNDDHDDDNFDDPSVRKCSKSSKKPRLSSSDSKTPKKDGENKSKPKNSFQLPEDFNTNDYISTKVVSEKSDENDAPQSKEVSIWKCPKCSTSFTKVNNFKSHFSKYHGPNAQHRPVKFKPEPVPGKPGHFILHGKWEYEMKEEPETGKLFTCLTCGVQRKTKTFMKNHIDLDHNFTPKLSCPKCQKTFLYETAFKSHRCEPKERRKIHLVKELEDGSFIYNDKFPFVKIEDDMIEADGNGPGFQFQCLICNAKRKVYHVMVQHMAAIHENPKSFLCSDCGKVFSSAPKLKTHILVMHTSEIKFTCEYCGRPFKTQAALSGHKQRVHSEAIFKCPQEGCGKMYSFVPSLRKHCNRTGHTLPYDPSWDEPQIVSCFRCDTNFRNVRALKLHEFSCAGKKKQMTTKIYSCRECDKEFFSLQRCKEHEFNHKKERQLSLSSSATTTTTETTNMNDSDAPIKSESPTTTTQNIKEEIQTASNEQQQQQNLSLSFQNDQNFSPEMFVLQDNFTPNS